MNQKAVAEPRRDRLLSLKRLIEAVETMSRKRNVSGWTYIEDMLVDVQLTHGLADAVIAAEAVNRRVATSESLRAVGHDLVLLYTEMRCDLIVAASRSAEALVAAAVLMGNGMVHGMGDAGNTGRALIVDTAVVTAQAIYGTAEQLRATGSSWVGAAIIQRVRPDLDGLDSSLAVDQIADLSQ